MSFSIGQNAAAPASTQAKLTAVRRVALTNSTRWLTDTRLQRHVVTSVLRAIAWRRQKFD